MASLPRKTQKIFGSDGMTSPTGILPKFGSLKAGAVAWSNDPDVIQELAAYAAGFAAATIPVGGEPVPAMQDFNALHFLATRQLAYLFDKGMPEWDTGTTYGNNSFCQASGVIYRSIQDDNLGNDPTSTPLYWTLAITNTSPIKAWVTFDGRTGVIDQQSNVASITRSSAGTYIVNFTTAMADAYYVVTGTAGSRPGVSGLQGDDNYITTGRVGQTPLRTTTQCRVHCYDRPNGYNEDASLISLQFVGN
jgi:hypothetical protein